MIEVAVLTIAYLLGSIPTALILGISQQWILLAYCVGAFAFIPFKIFLDSHRRKEIETASLKQTPL